MGTSNWQNISWCVQAIMRIQPQRVLDIGVGFGRWGILMREFGEVWFGRVRPDDWSIHLEGIEAFAKNVSSYHREFYSHLHVGDALDIIPKLDNEWDLIIFGDVLEHFAKSDGERLLDWSIDSSRYVLINLPLGDDWPQEDAYENPYEEHKAVWELKDFDHRPILASQKFLDFNERLFASVLLSRDDPKDLRSSFFGSRRQGEVTAGAEAAVLPEDALIAAVEARLGAVHAIRNSNAWRLLRRMRNNPLLWRAISLLPGARGRPVTVRHLGRKSSGLAATELCMLSVESDGEPVFWDFLSQKGGWQLCPRERAAFGECLVAREAGASARWFDYGGSLKLVFATGPEMGLVEVATGREKHILDLETETEAQAAFHCDEGAFQVQGRPRSAAAKAPASPAPILRSSAEEDEYLLERLRSQSNPTLAVCVPEWRGIRNSTANLFRTVRPLPSPLSNESREAFLRLIEAAKCENLVLSGGATEHLHLCHDIRKRAPQTKIKLLWHGSFLQVREEYAWRSFRLALHFARKGLLHTLGFVKQGMSEAAQQLGLRASFVMNYVPAIPSAPSHPAEGGPHIGLWISNEGWRKVPYAMAMAARCLPGAQLHTAGEVKRLQEFAGVIGLKTQNHGSKILSQQDLQKWMRLMHLNLYVTLSECCPMLPLESLSIGTPCLLGPTSHLFRDEPYLFERLVVQFPDNSQAIAARAERALAERDEIVDAYRRYAGPYNDRARASVAAFLDS